MIDYEHQGYDDEKEEKLLNEVIDDNMNFLNDLNLDLIYNQYKREKKSKVTPQPQKHLWNTLQPKHGSPFPFQDKNFNRHLGPEDTSSTLPSVVETKEPLLLHIQLLGSSVSIYKAELKDDIQEQTIIVPCGHITQGGMHLAR